MEEQTVDELAFENAQLHVDLNLTRFDGCMLMVNRLLSMQTHVYNYGIDSTFLALYNRDGQLSAVCDVKFPACEDILSDYDLNRRYLDACMEGLGSAIADAFNWVIERIKGLFRWIGEMWQRFINLFKTSYNSAKTKSKVSKLRNSKLVKKLSAKVASGSRLINISKIIQENEALFERLATDTLTDQDKARVNESKNILKGLADAGKKGAGDKEVTSIEIANDSDKNRCLNMVLDFQTQSDRVINALGLHIGRLKNIESKLMSNMKIQASNKDAHKGNKKKNPLKDKDLDIRARWKSQLATTRDLLHILSLVMKSILRDNKITQNTLNLIYKACKASDKNEARIEETNAKYEERHPDSSLT